MSDKIEIAVNFDRIENISLEINKSFYEFLQIG